MLYLNYPVFLGMFVGKNEVAARGYRRIDIAPFMVALSDGNFANRDSEIRFAPAEVIWGRLDGCALFASSEHDAPFLVGMCRVYSAIDVAMGDTLLFSKGCFTIPSDELARFEQLRVRMAV